MGLWLIDRKSCVFQLRRIIGDFGVPIAILVMVLVDRGVEDMSTQVALLIYATALLPPAVSHHVLLNVEAERAQRLFGVQSREAWLAGFSSGLRWTVSCLDDGCQCPARCPRLHPYIHGVPDYSVKNSFCLHLFDLWNSKVFVNSQPMMGPLIHNHMVLLAVRRSKSSSLSVLQADCQQERADVGERNWVSPGPPHHRSPGWSLSTVWVAMVVSGDGPFCDPHQRRHCCMQICPPEGQAPHPGGEGAEADGLLCGTLSR